MEAGIGHNSANTSLYFRGRVDQEDAQAVKLNKWLSKIDKLEADKKYQAKKYSTEIKEAWRDAAKEGVNVRVLKEVKRRREEDARRAAINEDFETVEEAEAFEHELDVYLTKLGLLD